MEMIVSVGNRTPIKRIYNAKIFIGTKSQWKYTYRKIISARVLPQTEFYTSAESNL